LVVQHRFAHNAGHYPSGQAISTVLDLARFAGLHLAGGRVDGEQLLSSEAIAAMHAPTVELGDGAHYGLTFRIGSHRGLRRVGHGGAIAGFGARLDMLPEAGLGVALAFNRLARELPADRLVEEIFDQTLD
jgi:CubicO group peptidase (beta-lactamase class C family)